MATSSEYALRVAKLEDDLNELDAVSRGVGTEAGRALAVRKMMADEDYNLASMSTAYRAGTLTPETLIEAIYQRMERQTLPGAWVHLVDKQTALARARALSQSHSLASAPLYGAKNRAGVTL